MDLTLRVPEELLLHITGLSDKLDIFNLRLTCKKFERLGSDALSRRLTRLCVTSTTESMINHSQICNHAILGKHITEVMYVRQPGNCEDVDIVDHKDVPIRLLRGARPFSSRNIPHLEWWHHMLRLQAIYFQWLKKGVKSLPRLSRLTYAREWPDDGAWNILKSDSRGPYPEALDDEESSLEDDWSGLRCVLETFKEIRRFGKTVSLELRTPMASGMLGPDIPELDTLILKTRLLCSAMAFLTRLDIFIPWFISDEEVRSVEMAAVFNLAVNLEHFQLQWPYGDCTSHTLAAQVLEKCTWPRLSNFHLLRSGGLRWIEIESPYQEHERYDDTFNLPYHLLRTFFARHGTIRDLQLRNILVGEFADDSIVWDERLNDSPAISPLRHILGLLHLQRCSVVLDTFKSIAEDWDTVEMLNEEIYYVGQKFGTRVERLESHHPNIYRSYDFAEWLMQTSA